MCPASHRNQGCGHCGVWVVCFFCLLPLSPVFLCNNALSHPHCKKRHTVEPPGGKSFLFKEDSQVHIFSVNRLPCYCCCCHACFLTTALWASVGGNVAPPPPPTYIPIPIFSAAWVHSVLLKGTLRRPFFLVAIDCVTSFTVTGTLLPF